MMTAFVWEFPLTLLFVVAVLRSGAWEKKERERERRGNVIWLQSAILSPEQLTQLAIAKRKTVRTSYKYKLRIHVDVKIFLPKSFPLKFQRIRNDGKSISVDLWLYCIYRTTNLHWITWVSFGLWKIVNFLLDCEFSSTTIDVAHVWS